MQANLTEEEIQDQIETYKYSMNNILIPAIVKQWEVIQTDQKRFDMIYKKFLLACEEIRKLKQHCNYHERKHN